MDIDWHDSSHRELLQKSIGFLLMFKYRKQFQICVRQIQNNTSSVRFVFTLMKSDVIRSDEL